MLLLLLLLLMPNIKEINLWPVPILIMDILATATDCQHLMPLCQRLLIYLPSLTMRLHQMHLPILLRLVIILVLWLKPGLSVYPFVRYEYYNTMEDVQGAITKDDRMKCKLLTFGLNYYMLPNLVLKGDYSHRIVGDGNYNNENTLSFAISPI